MENEIFQFVCTCTAWARSRVVFWFARTLLDLMGPLATWPRPFLYDNLSEYTHCIHFKEKMEKQRIAILMYVYGLGQVKCGVFGWAGPYLTPSDHWQPDSGRFCMLIYTQ